MKEIKAVVTSISDKYPTYRDVLDKGSYRWLEGKRIDDNAEGLWRINDTLYDLTEFIDKHPGGPDWLRLTKGTDITEIFEVHHISTKPKLMLPGFKVRKATAPRHMKLTFKEDGFFNVLKNKVRKELPKISKSHELKSNLIIDTLLTLTFVGATLSAYLNKWPIAILTGIIMTWTVISSHNYFHKKDNWRMKIFNLGFMSYRNWRISHAISHHVYPNSLFDLEISLLEPFMCWMPNPNTKGILQRYGSWIYGPIIYSALYPYEFLKTMHNVFISKIRPFYLDDLIPILVPIVMLAVGNSDIIKVLTLWSVIIISSSYCFSLIGLHAGHHHPDIAHDGDALREELDFGIYQLETVMDRSDLKVSDFLALSQFGHHALHHLFPILDHGILPQLYDIFYETCAEFETELSEYSWIHHIVGQHKQLARVESFKNPRNVKKI